MALSSLSKISSSYGWSAWSLMWGVTGSNSVGGSFFFYQLVPCECLSRPVTQTASLVTSKYDCCCIYLHILVHCSSTCSEVNDQRFSVGISHVSVFHFSSFPTVSRNSHFFLMIKKKSQERKSENEDDAFFAVPIDLIAYGWVQA